MRFETRVGMGIGLKNVDLELTVILEGFTVQSNLELAEKNWRRV